MIDLRLLVAGAALVAAFGAGMMVQGWRGGAENDRLRAQHAGVVAAANRSALALQRRLEDDRAANAEQLAQIDQAGTVKLKEAQDEKQRLERCIADGTCGLRVRTVQRACSGGDVSGATAAGRLDPPASAELDPAVGPAYRALREGIRATEVTLLACQQSLDQLTQIKR